MDIIRDLEPHSRGPYTGTLGYIGDQGRSDFNILIRSLLVSSQRLELWTGCGIVADSDPEHEYQESLAKARLFSPVEPYI
jgi:anthranilate/para-aminobenzoate synthase component I